MKLFAVRAFATAVTTQVTCLRDVAIDPFARNVEDVTTHCCMALNLDLQGVVHSPNPQETQQASSRDESLGEKPPVAESAS